MILLLIFMVAGIYFLRDLLLFVFTRPAAARAFARRCSRCCSARVSARAVGVSRCADRRRRGRDRRARLLRGVSPRRFRQAHTTAEHDAAADDARARARIAKTLDQFRAFLRGLMMHGAVGTAIGGVTTQVGEPQNLLIAEQADWNFGEFFLAMAPVSHSRRDRRARDLLAGRAVAAGSATARRCPTPCAQC